jgi:23S rRNA (adenine2503-C2)-methyltransferase
LELLNHTLDDLVNLFKHEFGKGEYHAAALYRELFQKGNAGFLTALEFENSPKLAAQIKKRMTITPGTVEQTFKEGDLTKFITRLDDGAKIESVIIPMTNHSTLCVSSQVGCKRGCRFCQTARMGFKRDLDVNEIVGQLYNARFHLKKKIKNVVFMGMGEPFDNFSNVIQAVTIISEQRGMNIACRHITISTCGLSDGIKKLGRLNMPGIRLAISINAPDDEKRNQLMPVGRVVNLSDLKSALHSYPLPGRGCFLFEYILIKGFNDAINDAITLADYIKPLPVRLNLIPYNPVAGFKYESPSDDEMHRFAKVLTDHGVFVIKRWSKGRSVSAGCGQLGRV